MLDVVALPPNFRGVWGTVVTSDMYDIGLRIAEVDPNLSVWKLELGDRVVYSIVENCRDGEERLVFRTTELDARIIEKLQYLLHVPFEKRFAEAERIEAKAEEDRQAVEHEELYARIGEPMRRQLEHDGFITLRNRSYSKKGTLGPRRGAGR